MTTIIEMQELIATIRGNAGQATEIQIEQLCSFVETTLPVSKVFGGKVCPNCSFRMHNRRLSCPSCEHHMLAARPYKSVPIIQSEDCLICLTTCSEEAFECGHLFHRKCVVQRCRDHRKTTCPSCRQRSPTLTAWLDL